MLSAEDQGALTAALREEVAAYRGLGRATAAQQAALLSGKAAAVEASLHAQMAALAACRRASDARAARTQAAAAALELGLPCRLGRLLGALPEAVELRAGYGELSEAMAELRERNAANRRLSEHRLDLLHGDLVALEAMLRAATGEPAAEGDAAAGSFLSLRA